MENSSKPQQSQSPQQLIEAMHARLPGVVRAICHTKQYYAVGQDAEDISQEILLSLIKNDYRGLLTFDDRKSSQTTWLSMITSRYVGRHVRKQNQRKAEPLTEAIACSLACEPQQEAIVLEMERKEKVRVAVEGLTQRQREFFNCIREEASMAEIAGVMGMRTGSVRTRKHIITRKLRERVTEMTLCSAIVENKSPGDSG